MSQGPEIDVSPAWSNDLLFFARYSDDTNLDGQLSIDDNPNIWKLDIKAGRAENLRQLTDSSSYDFFHNRVPTTPFYLCHIKKGPLIFGSSGNRDEFLLQKTPLLPLRDSIENAKSIILLAEGRLEFLPGSQVKWQTFD